jgi:hypothetical protein
VPNIFQRTNFAQTLGRGHRELLLRFNCYKHNIAHVSGFKDASLLREGWRFFEGVRWLRENNNRTALML